MGACVGNREMQRKQGNAAENPNFSDFLDLHIFRQFPILSDFLDLPKFVRLFDVSVFCSFVGISDFVRISGFFQAGASDFIQAFYE